jgi:nucleoside-diphosphate-sugar epimerase
VYGRVKLETEVAARSFADSVPVSIVRPPMVFGEGDRAMLPLFRQAARGYALRVGSGDRRISLVHVADLAQALIAIAERGQRVIGGSDAFGSGVYFAASRERPTWTELSAWMVKATGQTKSRAIACPRAVLWCAAAAAELYGRLFDRPVPLNLDKYREIVAGSWTCDVGKLAELSVEMEAVRGRLTSTARWYRERGWLDP